MYPRLFLFRQRAKLFLRTNGSATRRKTNRHRTKLQFLVFKCISINPILTNETSEYSSKIRRMYLFPGQSQHSGGHRKYRHFVSISTASARLCSQRSAGSRSSTSAEIRDLTFDRHPLVRPVLLRVGQWRRLADADDGAADATLDAVEAQHGEPELAERVRVRAAPHGALKHGAVDVRGRRAGEHPVLLWGRV